MLEELPTAPADPLMQALAVVRNDRSSDKVDLGVGVYHDENGRSPVLSSVKDAERWLQEHQQSKSYLSSAGSEEFAAALEKLIFGESSVVLNQKRVATIQTIGGSGALRVAGDLARRANENASIWIPNMSWANHKPIFGAAGLPVKAYAYYDRENHALDFNAMAGALERIPRGDVVLLHGCCHNPTGADLTLDQWGVVAAILSGNGVVPLVDIAYQGFADNVDADAAGLRLLASRMAEMFVTASCSKNFSLYRDRIGALAILAPDPEKARNAFNTALSLVRTNYSMPADHGAAVVTRILSTPSVKATWLDELEFMRTRVQAMREALAALLNDGGDNRFDYLRRQRGMFSIIDVTPEQANQLRAEHHVHIIGNGRINFAGLSDNNVERVASALRRVGL